MKLELKRSRSKMVVEVGNKYIVCYKKMPGEIISIQNPYYSLGTPFPSLRKEKKRKKNLLGFKRL